MEYNRMEYNRIEFNRIEYILLIQVMVLYKSSPAQQIYPTTENHEIALSYRHSITDIVNET